MTGKPPTRDGHRRVSKASKGDSYPTDGEAVCDFRRRMRSIGRLLREAFGEDREHDPAVVTRDAYRVVVSRIIEALANAKPEISTEELIALSKAVAEQRRLDIARLEIERKYPQEVPPNDTDSPGPSRPLPKAFGRVVRDIYGTNLAELQQRADPNDSKRPLDTAGGADKLVCP